MHGSQAFSLTPAITATTVTTPEVPKLCEDPRYLNYQSSEYERFEIRASDENGEFANSGEQALKGYPSADGYDTVSALGDIQILIKLTEICVGAKVVGFHFILRGATSFDARVGAEILIYVSASSSQEPSFSRLFYHHILDSITVDTSFSIPLFISPHL